MISTQDYSSLSTSSFWSDSCSSLSSLQSGYGLQERLQDPLRPDVQLFGSSSAPPALATDPGNGPGQAFDSGTLNGKLTFSDFVGSSDPDDYYRLNLSAPGSLNVALDGLSADANLQLFNSNGILIGSSAQVGILPESINLSGLSAGTYYVRVYQSSGNTNYNLTLTADLAGNTLSTARNLGSLSGTQSLGDFVGSSDTNDYYQFNLNAPGSLNLVVNGLSADANLQLFNSSSALIGSSAQLSNLTESINSSSLAAGTYYIRVYQATGETNYTLSVSTSLPTETSLVAPSISIPSTPDVGVASTTANSWFSNFSIADASGDNTLNTAFQGGAIRLNYSVQNVAALSNVRLEALKNGSLVSTLGTWAGASLTNELLNLASFSTLTAGDYQFRVVARNTIGQDFYSTAQAFKILNNSRINGTFGADTLDYSTGLGTGAIFLGRGGTDTLNLGAAGISRTTITSIDGLSLVAFTPSSATNQAIYGGTAFDYLTLSDGREIYFQGIEYLRFADGTTLELQVHPNDPYFNYQWNLAVSDVPDAWRFTQGSSNVLLASLDTGILTPVGGSGGIVDIATSRLITDASDDDNFNDYGHGHSAISIMAGAANNGSGIAGINWNSSVYVNDVYGSSRVTLQQAIKDTLSYARANNLRVVFQAGIQGDFWLTDGGTQAELEQLIQANSDIAVFAIAAGNGGPGGNNNEANYLTSVSGVAQLQTKNSNVMSAGALQRTGTATVNGMTNATAVDIASYSNRGSNLTLVAATDSPAMDRYGNMNIFGGTSAANPNLAGIASLVWSVNPSLTGAQVRQILTDTAMDLGTAGRDNTYGYGLVNADAAVRRALALQRNAQVANLYSGASLIV